MADYNYFTKLKMTQLSGWKLQRLQHSRNEMNQVKVKVTRAKKCQNFLIPQCKNSITHNTGSTKHRDIKFACSIRFFKWRIE